MAETETSAASREFITFRIGAQHYGVDIMSVREIRGWTPATALPRSPAYVRGVINLRGVVLPIVDLADRLGFPPSEPTPRHVIIVAQSGRQLVGLLVDAVSDIINVARSQVQPTPNVGSDSGRAFVHGVIADDERMIGLIAIESVMPALASEAA